MRLMPHVRLPILIHNSHGPNQSVIADHYVGNHRLTAIPIRRAAPLTGNSMRITCSSPEQIRGSQNISGTNPCWSCSSRHLRARPACPLAGNRTAATLVASFSNALRSLASFAPSSTTLPAVTGSSDWLAASRRLPAPALPPPWLCRVSPHPRHQEYPHDQSCGHRSIGSDFKEAAQLPCRRSGAFRHTTSRRSQSRASGMPATPPASTFGPASRRAVSRAQRLQRAAQEPLRLEPLSAIRALAAHARTSARPPPASKATAPESATPSLHKFTTCHDKHLAALPENPVSAGAVLCNFLHQHLVRPMQARTNRPDRASQRDGRIGITQFLQIAQHHGFPIMLRQRQHGFPDRRRRLPSGDVRPPDRFPSPAPDRRLPQESSSSPRSGSSPSHAGRSSGPPRTDKRPPLRAPDRSHARVAAGT